MGGQFQRYLIHQWLKLAGKLLIWKCLRNLPGTNELMRSCSIYLLAISQDLLKMSVTKICLKKNIDRWKYCHFFHGHKFNPCPELFWENIKTVLRVLLSENWCRHLKPLLMQHDGVIKWKYFRVTGHLCGEFTKPSDAELWCFLWSAPI